MDRILPFIDKPMVKVITGMRRTGKSTVMKLLMKHLKQSGISQDRIVYVNMESLDNNHLRDIYCLHEHIRNIKKNVGDRLYIFIDEVQEIPDWQKVLNSFLTDEDGDIYISGSNSKMLSGELATLLTGRYVQFRIYPLVLSEFAVFMESAKSSRDSLEPLFEQFLRFGGMPGIHHLEFVEQEIYQYLSAISDSIILKDVVSRNNVRDVAMLEKIVQYIFDNIGNIFSGRKIADYFKNEGRKISHETVYNYLNYLENAMIIHKVPRFDLKGKKLLEVSEKYYLADMGLCHSLLGFKRDSINAHLENIVLIELLHRGYKVYVGKLDQYEVDFIAVKQNKKLYVQVCYLLESEKVREREMRPFRKIKDNFPKLLLTMDKLPQSNEDGIIRRFLPEWLIGVDG